jgi:predicted ATPase
MKRFVLTGAPGSGKTAIIRQLEIDGYGVVGEAATDVIALEQAAGIAEPWMRPAFIDSVTNLQRQRQLHASCQVDKIQFYDRCVICTVALAEYLGYPLSDLILREVDRVKRESIYEKRVFFVQNLGFITPTEARRITFEETLRFERIHEEAYRRFGFEIFPISSGSVPDRVAAVRRAIAEVWPA